jgi:hypothetical protein
MAKEKRNIKVKAMVNLKYDKDVIKIGQEFLVRKSDVEDIKSYIEVLGEVRDEKDPGKDDNSDDGKKAGE